MELRNFAGAITALANALGIRCDAGTVTLAAGPDGLRVASGEGQPAPIGTPPPPFMPARFADFDLTPGPGVQFDENGIPSIVIWSTQQFTQSPTTIAQWGLGGYARGDYAKARKAADWLLANQRADGGFPLPFDHIVPGQYTLRAPWCSAITQGNAISLLARMHCATGDLAYRVAAVRGVHLLDTPVALGGLQGKLNGAPWFEETPDPAYPNHIFNGSVFALLGLGDVWELLGDADAGRLWKVGEQSLAANINAHIVWAPLARPGYPDPWGLYELQVNGVPAVPHYLREFYMGLHCDLIEEMGRRTGRATYGETATVLRRSLQQFLIAPPPQ